MTTQEVEIAGHTVRIDAGDEAEVGVLATMLAEAVEQNGPCMVDPECAPEPSFFVMDEGEPTATITLLG